MVVVVVVVVVAGLCAILEGCLACRLVRVQMVLNVRGTGQMEAYEMVSKRVIPEVLLFPFQPVKGGLMRRNCAKSA